MSLPLFFLLIHALLPACPYPLRVLCPLGRPLGNVPTVVIQLLVVLCEIFLQKSMKNTVHVSEYTYSDKIMEGIKFRRSDFKNLKDRRLDLVQAVYQ